MNLKPDTIKSVKYFVEERKLTVSERDEIATDSIDIYNLELKLKVTFYYLKHSIYLSINYLLVYKLLVRKLVEYKIIKRHIKYLTGEKVLWYIV